jgi:XTP/dITP diphosphohydrolase
MAVTELRFVSRNPEKVREVTAILGRVGVKVQSIDVAIEELQTDNSDRLIRHKAIAAYERVRQQLIVEHTGLHLEYLNGLPGGLTQVFWDRLLADRFASLFGNTSDPGATARTQVAYVDGKTIFVSTGEIKGRIAKAPAGPQGFQWDCVFVPSGYTQTFAEMGTTKKNEISMRRQALDKLAERLK